MHPFQAAVFQRLHLFPLSLLQNMYFDFVSMEALNSVEGVTFEKVGNDYVLTITKDASEEGTLQIKVNNKIEPDRPYEDKTTENIHRKM